MAGPRKPGMVPTKFGKTGKVLMMPETKVRMARAGKIKLYEDGSSSKIKQPANKRYR